jgi:hypothetical protein
VLTRRSESARGLLIDDTTKRWRGDANGARKPASANVKITRSDCAAGVSVIHAFNAQHTLDAATQHRSRAKARCADSESSILAIKKFSCPPPSRLIGARQDRIFARIAPG